MVSKKVMVTNKTGLHARPASNLVTFFKKYNSKISLSNGEKTVSAASIIHVLTLGVKQGTQLEVIAEGEDEATAVEEIVAFIENLDE